MTATNVTRVRARIWTSIWDSIHWDIMLIHAQFFDGCVFYLFRKGMLILFLIKSHVNVAKDTTSLPRAMISASCIFFVSLNWRDDIVVNPWPQTPQRQPVVKPVNIKSTIKIFEYCFEKYLRHLLNWWSSWFQVLACRVRSARPLPELNLNYCMLDPWEQKYWK